MPPVARRILFVALVVTTVLTGCTGGAKKHAATQTSSETFTRATVKLDVSRAELVSPHQVLGPLDPATTDKVRTVVERMLLVTSASPLVEGRAGAGFAELFTPDAGARAASSDRAAVFDEGLPRFGTLHTDTARVGLTGLAGTLDPSTALVVAKFDWDVTSVDRPNDRVTRTGELSLIPVGGTWKIGAYTVVVTRTIDDTTTTTTAKSG
jgi:hypothetical protein